MNLLNQIVSQNHKLNQFKKLISLNLITFKVINRFHSKNNYSNKFC